MLKYRDIWYTFEILFGKLAGTLWLHRCQNREHLASSFRFLFLLEHVNHIVGLFTIFVTIFHCKFFNNSQRPHTENPDNASVRMGGHCLSQMITTYMFVSTPVLIVSESEFTNGVIALYIQMHYLVVVG